MTELTRNRMLRLLPEAERARLAAAGRIEAFERGETLQAPEAPIERVHFPLSGVVSLLAELSDGQSAEAATVGREGMVGIPVFLGARISSTRAVAQTSGEALVIPCDRFRSQLSEHGQLERFMARYVELIFITAAQFAACGRHHAVQPRVARSILTWLDRMGGPNLRVTHEAVAEAIGARRASVSEAISRLSASGALKARRGMLQVDDRRLLEAESCECYEAILAAFDRTDW
jgi:CRP-like cAMP-binding protein